MLTTAGVVAFLVHMTETQVALSLMTCTEILHSEESTGGAGLGVTSLGEPANDNDTSSQLLASSSEVDSSGSAFSRSCEGLPAGDQALRLLDDLELCCNDAHTQGYMFGLGVPALLLYSFGIPFVTGVVLWVNKGKLTDPRVATTFGFMRAGYRDTAFWFECVVMLRKALLVSIAVGLAPLGIEV